MGINNTKFLAGCAAIDVLLNNYLQCERDPKDIDSVKAYIDDYAVINKALTNISKFCMNDADRDSLNALVLKVKSATLNKINNLIEIISNSHLAIDITTTVTHEDSIYLEHMNQYLIDAINHSIYLANARNELHHVKLKIKTCDLGYRNLKLKAISDITNLYTSYGFKDVEYDIKDKTFSGVVTVITARETFHTMTRIPLTKNLIVIEGITNYDHHSKGGMLHIAKNNQGL